MALEAAFSDLPERVRALSASFDNLLWAVAEGKPADGSHAVADHYADVSTELVGTAQEVAQQAARARAMVTGDHPDLALAGRALASCQERFNHLGEHLLTALASFDRMSALASLGQERKGEWQAWAHNVIEEVERCRDPLHEVSRALLACWEEIAERVGTTTVSVRATGIGQQLIRESGRSD
ncbi:MAG: hypothetical protein ACRDJG_12040 [Actinomycetota bacterium]